MPAVRWSRSRRVPWAHAGEEVTLPQYRALVVLASRGPQRIVDLAGFLDVTASTATRMCDRLVRKGLVRRQRLRATGGPCA